MLKLEGEKEKSMEENAEEEHRAIQELRNERDFGLVKEEIYRFIRDKVENLDSARVAEAVSLELEARRLGESLKVSRNAEALLRAMVLELEQSVEVLTEERDEVERKFEQADTELGQMGSNVDVLMREKEALKNALLEAQGECFDDDLNALSSSDLVRYPDTEEDCFAVDQCWASCDSPDGLPRSYAVVRNVCAGSPLKLEITWLEPDPDDQGEVDWRDAGLPIGCGKFKLGDSEDVTALSIFTHQMHCVETSGEGSYMVYPKKGETWAIFRDWDIKWSSDPENCLRDEFEYVEILSDFAENVGIVVAYLVEVKGFVSLFRKAEKNGVSSICCVLPNELYRFSHRIPSYKTTGEERKVVPRGCFELDTAALPTKDFAKTVNLELEVRQLYESLKISRDEEALMGAKILELEQNIGLAMEKELEMERKYSAVVSEKKEMEKSIEVVTEKSDSVLEDKQRELDEANRARNEIEQFKISHEYKMAEFLREVGRVRDEIEQVKISHECEIAEFQGEAGRVRDVLDELNGSFRDLKEKNEQLLSEVHHYRNVVDEVMLEKDNMRKGFEEEKTNVENLELQVAEMKEKLEQAHTELAQMRSQREMLNKINKELERNVDVLKKQKEALHLKAQQECDDLNRDVRNKRSNPTEETSTRKKGKIEQSHFEGENVLESDPDLRRSKEDDTCTPLNSNAPSSPDPDFNDFGKDKAEDCFAVNQFWAMYDVKDSLPRFYALVRKVTFPFKLKITWLEADPDDGGEIDWLCAELPIACGKFKLGDSKTVKDRGMFSHQIKCMETSGEGSYLVYPNKGETWAIFKDWDIKWSSSPENHLTDEFEYVEILSDFAENVGIEVSHLVKVKGFASVFQKTEKNGINISCVLPNEMYRFSHRIPSYKMKGKNRKGVPRGCFEFDTLALPTNFA